MPCGEATFPYLCRLDGHPAYWEDGEAVVLRASCANSFLFFFQEPTFEQNRWH